MAYEHETQALIHAIEDDRSKAKQALRELNQEDLDALVYALDILAAWADGEAIGRAEKRA